MTPDAHSCALACVQGALADGLLELPPHPAAPRASVTATRALVLLASVQPTTYHPDPRADTPGPSVSYRTYPAGMGKATPGLARELPGRPCARKPVNASTEATRLDSSGSGGSSAADECGAF